MVVAAHLCNPGAQGQSYLSSLLQAQTATDRFIFFIDKKERKYFRLPSNAVIVDVSPSPKNGLLLRYWYRFKLPGLLRQYGATVFFSEFPGLSPEVNLPQSVFISSASQLKRPGFSRYFSSFYNQCKRAEEIFIAGNHLKRSFPLNLLSNISLLPPVVEADFKPLSHEERDLVQKDFAGNRDYFLLNLRGEHNHLLVPVLKGFSRFKKWQKSSFRMLVITTGGNAAAVEELIGSYKYREEVQVYSTLSLTAKAQVVGAAFASMHLTEKDIDVKALLQSAACEIPQLLQKSVAAEAVMGDAAFYFDVTPDSVMRALQDVYRDENSVAAMKTKAKILCTDSGALLTAFLQPALPEKK